MRQLPSPPRAIYIRKELAGGGFDALKEKEACVPAQMGIVVFINHFVLCTSLLTQICFICNFNTLLSFFKSLREYFKGHLVLCLYQTDFSFPTTAGLILPCHPWHSESANTQVSQPSRAKKTTEKTQREIKKHLAAGGAKPSAPFPLSTSSSMLPLSAMCRLQVIWEGTW